MNPPVADAPPPAHSSRPPRRQRLRDGRPPGYRYVNEAAGLFVIALVIAGVLALVAVARAQRWFEPTARLTVRLPEEGSFGLQPGAGVYVMGVSVGTVRRVRIREGRMTADVTLRADFAPFVRADSVGVLRKSLGVAGDTYVEITRGTGAPLWTGDDESVPELATRIDSAPDDALREMVQQVRSEVVPTIQELRRGAEQLTALLTRLNDPGGATVRLLDSAAEVAGRLERREGLVGRLAGDERLADDVQGAVADLREALAVLRPLVERAGQAAESATVIAANAAEASDQLPALARQTGQAMTKLDALLDDLARTSQTLPAIAGKIDRETDALPGLLVQVQETVRQIQRLTEGIQQHWLIREYVAPDTLPGQLSPGAVGAGGGAEAGGGDR